MRKMIELTRLDDGPLWVNPDHIVTVEKPLSSERGSARIMFASGRYITVHETVDEVIQIIWERD